MVYFGVASTAPFQLRILVGQLFVAQEDTTGLVEKSVCSLLTGPGVGLHLPSRNVFVHFHTKAPLRGVATHP